VAKVIGGHWGLAPKLQDLAIRNKIKAYNLPQGVLSHMYRDIAAHKPRTISTVGLHTFVDPRLDGGKLNAVTTEDIVELITFDSKEYLAYKTFPINVAVIRGTTADTNGNITMEKEALTLESLALAMAAKNSGGFVIAQVERIAESDSLNPRQVKIPGILVDCVVLAKPENHMQTFDVHYNPAFSGEIRVPIQSVEPMAMSERKIIARRAAFELEVNSVTNLGIGMPEGIAKVANEEKILDLITLTAEPGLIGGLPAGGLSFGAGTNAAAVIDQPNQFDFYDGGGLDIAFLGLAQADQNGNLNVSKFGPKIAGAGGFINISQNAQKIVFVGTFTAKGLDIAVRDGKLVIVREGEMKKFIRAVEQITFSGNYAVEKKQPVLFITERCVFSYGKNGMELIEIAPGVDLQKDILDQMEFKPFMPKEPRLMDERIFRAEPMGIKERLLSVSLEERLNYNPEKNMFFVNFEGLTINTREDIENIENTVVKILSPLNHKVSTIVNYDNVTINPDIVDDYTIMVDRLVKRYYSGVTRYTTSAFLRLKLGEALKKRNVAPHIYESSEEAENALNLKR
jgi:propionate CoA-transferase